MKKHYLLLLMTIFLVTFEIKAQDDENEDSSSAPLSISGSVDAYFRTNLTAPNDEDAIVPGSSFANLSGFSLGMANLVFSHEGEKAGFVADLVFGPRGEDAVFASPYYSPDRGSSQIINQLYAYWNVTDAVTLTLGNFNTYLGYEVISPTANFNYSTSYMFSYGPFSHTGLKADFSLPNDVSVMLAVMNPTDATEFNPIASYTFGAQLGFKGVYLNFLYGDQDGNLDKDKVGPDEFSQGTTLQADLTAGWDLSKTLYFGVNTTYNTTGSGERSDATSDISEVNGDAFGFYGAAVYLQLAASEAFTIGTRVEYFKEFMGGAGAIGMYDAQGDAHVIDITLTGQYKVGNLTIIPELRLDSGSEDGTFYDSDLAASKSLSSFLLAAVYSF